MIRIRDTRSLWGELLALGSSDNYNLRLSYAQCRSACLWTGLQEKSPLAQLFLIWAMWRTMAFQRAICRSSSPSIRRPL